MTKNDGQQFNQCQPSEQTSFILIKSQTREKRRKQHIYMVLFYLRKT